MRYRNSSASNASQRKQIVVVSDALYQFSSGGKEERYRLLEDSFVSSEYELIFATSQFWDEGNSPSNYFAITNRRIGYKYGRRTITSGLSFALSCLKVIKLNPTIIEADQMPSLALFPLWFVSRICRAKFSVTWNEVWNRKDWKNYLGTLGAVGYMIDKIAMRLPDMIISVSPLTTERLIAGGARADRIQSLKHLIDVNQIRKSKSDLPSTDVLYTGRLLSHKRVDVLIRAIALLKEGGSVVTLTIIGEGPEGPFLRQLTKTLQIEEQVHFHDFFPDHTESWSLMNKCSIFDSPSEREGYGLAVAEAIASGIKVIAVDIETNASRLQFTSKEIGILLKENSPEQHAGAIKFILDQKGGSRISEEVVINSTSIGAQYLEYWEILNAI